MKKLFLSAIFVFASRVYAAPVTGFLFKSADGTQLFSKYYEAKDAKANVLVVHGLQSHSDWYQNGEHLRDRGFNVLIFDRRGSGRSLGKRGHADSKEKLLEDLDSAVQFIKSKNSNIPLHVVANSMGFFMTLPYAKLHPKAFDSIVLTTPSAAVTKKADYPLWKKAIILLSPSWHYFDTRLEATDFVSSGPWLDWVNSDFLGQREYTASFLRSLNNLRPISLDVRNADLSQVPLFMLLADKDTIVDNEKAESGFFADYPGPKKLLTLDSEHFLGFGDSAHIAEDEVLNWLRGAYLNP